MRRELKLMVESKRERAIRALTEAGSEVQLKLDFGEIVGDKYESIVDNPFHAVGDQPLSTFGLDVDGASFSNVRRYIEEGQEPPADSVRIEELINYFSYADVAPVDGEPLGVSFEVATCPWQPKNRLLRIGLRAKDVFPSASGSNLVFLLDVSGSMKSEDKLGLVKRSLTRLIEELGADDRVAIVVYAGSSGLVLPSTSCVDKDKILEAMNQLESGGSTNGGAGIELAYDVAMENFIEGGVNRVILATDGDFNVGTTGRSGLQKLIETKRESGVFLSVLGFGRGNLNDATAELLANKGQRQLLLHRSHRGGGQGSGAGAALDADHRRQGREAADRVQPARGRELPADRLRQPSARGAGFRRRPQGRRRARLGPFGCGALRTCSGERAGVSRCT